MRKIVAIVLAALAFSAAAVPASAAPTGVGSHCGTYLCVMTAHHNRFVQDITVRTRDGLPGTLRSYWGDFHSPKVNAASHRWAVGREQAGAKLVCGGLERDGRNIEDTCVTI
ncbi:hypothetical protein AF335_19290 [Streptomyces eurocidicus]|uniref:Phosphatidylserine decarboxylase n=1 Tax=Streptomyces eurocidicus TaxID=66423 RepID=A0A2N8NT46_STREU|nr:hypothetical protein [Streptomyces eurocidicus]MBB5119250.1 phosphatidylserine decarboxylase [Streptomyces eurocidicus]MBF6053162.1 hypothetical protein [Streptomyces eurocidicus]PNE31941.1 hypothetical protein AF335_19290 [Streptomyces eurocidicus]